MKILAINRFPKDCEDAYALGQRMVQSIKKQ